MGILRWSLNKQYLSFVFNKYTMDSYDMSNDEIVTYLIKKEGIAKKYKEIEILNIIKEI